MITDLDEAIKHCEEVAEEQEQKAKEYKHNQDNLAKLYHSLDAPYGGDYSKSNDCLECASEHRQLASWLKELKAYREQLPHEIKETKKRQARTLEVNVANEVYNPYLSEFVKGYICALSFVEGIVANIIEEVNADADSD